MFDPAAPPLTVKPRKPYTRKFSLIVIAPDGTYTEETAEVGGDPIPQLERLQPSLIITLDAERFLYEANRHYLKDDGWNWRLIASEHKIGTGELAQVRMDHLVSYCGFRRGTKTHYHYPISPGQYGRHTLDEISANESTVGRLYQWGNELRSYAEKHELRPTPTAGGMAAQLLRAKRFYSLPRRKVPKATNEKARPYLPGNHYELSAVPGKLYAAAYVLDQEAAHHRAAAELELPCANSLYARGNYQDENAREIWIENPDALAGLTGLVKARVFIPDRIAHAPWMPRNLSRGGAHITYLYTNEIERAQRLGVEIRGIVAGWLAEESDQGIREYANWALEERAQAPRWLKGTLLAAYGILGAKPRHVGGYYRQAKKGTKEQIWLVDKRVSAIRVMSEKEIQSPVANVIQRGMIEAEVRARSLELARELAAHKFNVYGIMADAVITEGNKPLPLLPPPFRVKERLAWVKFRHSQAYEGTIQLQSHYREVA